MSDTFEPVDAYDRDLALAATGLLDTFNAAGVLTAADVHVAANLGRVDGLEEVSHQRAPSSGLRPAGPTAR